MGVDALQVGEYDVAVELVLMLERGVRNDRVGDLGGIGTRELLPAARTGLLMGHAGPSDVTERDSDRVIARSV